MPSLNLTVKPLLHTLAVALAAAGICSCSTRGNDSTVPKPEAWPRIEVPAEEYTEHSFDNVSLTLNSVATVSGEAKDEGTWINITYPTFQNAHLYLTLSGAKSPDELKAILDNRRERMELNTGGTVTELTELTSDGGWEGLLAVTRSSLTTPVQLLAHDGNKVLSGVLYFNFPADTPADSVAPIVKTVRRDMIHALKHLRSL